MDHIGVLSQSCVSWTYSLRKHFPVLWHDLAADHVSENTPEKY